MVIRSYNYSARQDMRGLQLSYLPSHGNSHQVLRLSKETQQNYFLNKNKKGKTKKEKKINPHTTNYALVVPLSFVLSNPP